MRKGEGGAVDLANCIKQKEDSINTVLCDPPGVRTQDPIIKSDVLYQLS